jgi:hypothetical protein
MQINLPTSITRVRSHLALLFVLSLLIITPLLSSAQGTPPVPVFQEVPEPTEPPPLSATPGAEFKPTEERTMAPTVTPPTVDVGRALDIRNQARLTNLGANLSTRLENTISRLEQINARLIARQGIMGNLGFDTSAASVDLAAAGEALAAAKARIASIDVEVAKTASSNNPQANWLTLRGIYVATKADVLAAYQSQVRALTTLKNIDQTPLTPVEPINP